MSDSSSWYKKTGQSSIWQIKRCSISEIACLANTLDFELAQRVKLMTVERDCPRLWDEWCEKLKMEVIWQVTDVNSTVIDIGRVFGEGRRYSAHMGLSGILDQARIISLRDCKGLVV